MNGFFLVNHFGKSNKRAARNGQQNNFIVKELQFDASQTKQFKKLYSDHREKIKSISDGIRLLKDDFFDKVSDESINTSTIDSLATLIANKEKEKDIETFNHFRAVQKICNDQQKERFKIILKDALHKKRPNNPNSHKGKGGDRPPPR
jgi:hypothetical protein